MADLTDDVMNLANPTKKNKKPKCSLCGDRLFVQYTNTGLCSDCRMTTRISQKH